MKNTRTPTAQKMEADSLFRKPQELNYINNKSAGGKLNMKPCLLLNDTKQNTGAKGWASVKPVHAKHPSS